MTPGEATHKYCVKCAGSPYDVRDCGGDKCLNGGCDKDGVCYFYPFRLGAGRPSVRIIRKVCLWCMGGDKDFVRNCWTPDCPLHPFRMGKNPNFNLSDAEKERRVARLKREQNSIMAGRLVSENPFSGDEGYQSRD